MVEQHGFPAITEMGHFGLPRTPPRSAGQEFHQLFYAASDRPEFQWVRQWLDTDPRMKALEGQRICNGNAWTGLNTASAVAWWIWRANDVGATQASADLNAYADELNSAMHVAGWTNTRRTPMWATSDAGVFVATTEQTQGPEINIVATALQKAGVPAQVVVLKPDQIGTIPDHFQDHVLYILVGRQPPPATSSSR